MIYKVSQKKWSSSSAVAAGYWTIFLGHLVDRKFLSQRLL